MICFAWSKNYSILKPTFKIKPFIIKTEPRIIGWEIIRDSKSEPTPTASPAQRELPVNSTVHCTVYTVVY